MLPRMRDTMPVVVFLTLMVVGAFLTGLWSGMQVDTCFWLTNEVIVCGEGWNVPGVVS